MSMKTVVLAACLLWAGSVSAQSLPKPAEFYFDADASATQPLVATDKSGDAAVQDLLKAMERDPRDLVATAHLARLAMQGGREQLGRELYTRALSQVDAGNRYYRSVLWNYAWDLYRLGYHEEALGHWRTLVLSRGVNGGWMPQTLALALWTLDRREDAVQWYAAAVRTEPQDWGTTARYEALLPGWSQEERATLAEVHAAWAANPPS